MPTLTQERTYYIGTDASGSGGLGNSINGVRIANSSANTIGGTTAGASNTIAFNGAAGVLIYGASATGNSIRTNSIFSNGDIGIDLEADGVTPNDSGDADTGANNLQNFPLLTSVQQGSTIIQGTLNSTPNTSFIIDFFSSPSADPTNYGEGQTYIGSTQVTTNGSANANINVSFPAPATVGHYVSATATDPNGNTSEFSQVQQVAAPTAIELIDFAATTYQDSRGESFTRLEWQTGFEVANLGFNIYREEEGKRVRINDALIAGSSLFAGNKTTLTAGRPYAWWDKGIADCGSRIADCQNLQYWLEDIDLDGKSTLHGPMKPKVIGGLPPDQSTAALLSRIGAGQPRISQVGASQASPAAPSRERTEAQWEIASKPAIKLTIKEEGWYRVTQQELIAAGLDPKTDPRNLQLFLEGDEQAMLVAGEQDGSFDRTDSIEFYATGQDTPSTDAHVYWLISGKQPGKRINVIKSETKPGGAKSFSYTVERKERTLYFSSLRNGDAENFFGRVITPQPVDQGLTIQHLDSAAGNAVLEVALQGVTDLPGVLNDHQVKVTLNGAQVGRIIFDGRQHPVEKFVVPQGALKEGDNVVTLVAEAGPSDISIVDEIRVTYRHTYTADQDALRLVVEQASLVATRSQTIEGFTTASIRVADITDPSQPQELIGRIEEQKGGSFAATVEVTSNAQRTLMAFTADRIKHPVSIAANQPSSWHDKAHGADLLMITHRAFANNLAPLKALRQKQGFAVEIVDIEDFYDEFSFGEKSPQAVKDFLALARASWQLAPRFVLFVGGPSYDPKNYLGAGDFDFAPTKLIDTTYLETASDDWFADFNDDGLPEMYVGRLPVRTPAEAATVIAKIVGYDSAAAAGPGRRSVLLVADKNDGFNFEQASEQLSALVPVGTAVQSIFRGRLDDATAKTQLIGSINSGQSIVNYTGHGSTNVWRSLFTTSDVQALENKSLPLFITMTCLNGFIQDPVIESLGKGLIKSDRGGAVAVWASSGLTLPAQQALINQQLYRVIFGSSGVKGQPLTLGEAIAKAKAATKDLDVRRTWLLLGDPAMVVK